MEIIPNYHPILVHFTIALMGTSFVTYLLGLLLTRCQRWQTEAFIVSRWCLWLAALATIATVIAGFHAYFTVAHDTPSHQVMTVHRNWGIATAIVIWLMAICSLIKCCREKKPGVSFASGLLVAFILVMITGWYGAELVYRYGLGVKSLPTPSAHGSGHKILNKQVPARSHEDSNHAH